MERYTYEITFTRLDGQPDEIQQHTSEELAREAMRLAAHKLPIKCKFVVKEEKGSEE